MSQNHPSVLLSDDEVAAIAVSDGAAWFGPLPTIDVESANDLSTASTRGMRSLALRDLLDDDLAPVAALEPIRRAMERRAAVTTFIAVEGLRPADGSTISSFFVVGEDVVVIDVTHGSGVHAVGEVSTSEARTLILDSAREASETSQSHAESGLAWCLLVARPDSSATVLKVSAGKPTTYSLNTELQLTEVASSTAESLLAHAWELS
jgi:hypothetical protein